MPLAAIFEIDGTLVDTNYQHALGWYRAFRKEGIVVPIWQIHRAIGIGSDRVVELLAGKEVEATLGETLRDAQGPLYKEMIDEVEPMKGAHELLRDLKRAGHPVILASSAEEEEAERYIDLLDAREFVDGYTTSADVNATKPAPDIVQAAVQKAGGGPAVMIGDSTWDCKAATRAKVPSIGVLTGGFSERSAPGGREPWRFSADYPQQLATVRCRSPLRSRDVESRRPRLRVKYAVLRPHRPIEEFRCR